MTPQRPPLPRMPKVPTQVPRITIDSLRVSVPDMEPAKARKITEQALSRVANALETDRRLLSLGLKERSIGALQLRLELTNDSPEALEDALEDSITSALDKALENPFDKGEK